MTNTTALYHAIKPGIDHHNIDLHDLQPILHWPDEPFPFTHVPTVVFYAPRPGPVCEDGTKPTPYIAIGYKALRAEREQLFNVNCPGSDYICGRNFKLLLVPRETTARLLGEEAEKHDLDRAVARAKKLGYITNESEAAAERALCALSHDLIEMSTSGQRL
jgi:hypothetical protein